MHLLLGARAPAARLRFRVAGAQVSLRAAAAGAKSAKRNGAARRARSAWAGMEIKLARLASLCGRSVINARAIAHG